MESSETEQGAPSKINWGNWVFMLAWSPIFLLFGLFAEPPGTREPFGEGVPSPFDITYKIGWPIVQPMTVILGGLGIITSIYALFRPQRVPYMQQKEFILGKSLFGFRNLKTGKVRLWDWGDVLGIPRRGLSIALPVMFVFFVIPLSAIRYFGATWSQVDSLLTIVAYIGAIIFLLWAAGIFHLLEYQRNKSEEPDSGGVISMVIGWIILVFATILFGILTVAILGFL